MLVCRAVARLSIKEGQWGPGESLEKCLRKFTFSPGQNKNSPLGQFLHLSQW